MAERWLPVPDWPYEVSDLGRVRSVDRRLRDGRTAGGVLLRPWRDGKGYLCVTLRDGFRVRRVRVHRLVKRVHTGPPRGRQVRHKDDVKDNVTLDNLKYGTQKQNEQDKKRNQGQREREKERGRGKGEGRKRETDEIGRSFPGAAGCVIPCQGRERP
jgi:NUMOD4 motif/HNH endonuclease